MARSLPRRSQIPPGPFLQFNRVGIGEIQRFTETGRRAAKFQPTFRERKGRTRPHGGGARHYVSRSSLPQGVSRHPAALSRSLKANDDQKASSTSEIP